jgi:hypothetical protein
MDGLDDEMRYDDVCFLLCLDLDIWICILMRDFERACDLDTPERSFLVS